MRQEASTRAEEQSAAIPDTLVGGMDGARLPFTAAASEIGFCGEKPLIPGWLLEPADLLARMAHFDARLSEVAVAERDAEPRVAEHGGAGSQLAGALVLVWTVRSVTRRWSGWRRRATRGPRPDSRRRRLSLSVRYFLVRSAPVGILPTRMRRSVAAARRELGAQRMAATAEASGLTPEQVHAWALERMARERARLESEKARPTPIIVQRGRPNPNAKPVALPPHVAQMMARMRAARAQADAHSTYVRAERGPLHAGSNAQASGPSGTDVMRDAIARARARAGMQTRADGKTSWVVDD